MMLPPPSFEQLRPHPHADPGFRLSPDGTARFQHDGHLIDVLVRYTTEEDRAPYTATAEGDEVIVFASVDVCGMLVGRSWALAEWRNPYSLRDSLLYVLREAVDQTEHKVDEMAAQVARIRAKRPAATK
ncbi:hypothetical protein ACFXI8_27320 [Streptomyces niveus]|uniref:hypothetical protein n=1 Tax=Streptomyces niveus TaxID=193462 RepID=UPI00367BD7A5